MHKAHEDALSQKNESEKKSLFEALTNEAMQLHIKWHQYLELFDTDDERIDLMNKVSPRFFRIVQEALGHDIILCLARLTDRRLKDTVTIYRLPKEIQNENLRTKIQNLINDNEKYFEFCKTWRDNYLAHANLELHTQNDPFEKFLPQADRNTIGDALKAITDILKACEENFGWSSTNGFWDIEKIKIFDGAGKMLKILNEGQSAREKTS
ncbi:MAG: hypothetical protein H6869_08915 [Rhodospirillales bacterium]|nr:hypothetical protein [Rhodospirillales bacterium]